jgi:hypothetical protein
MLISKRAKNDGRHFFEPIEIKNSVQRWINQVGRRQVPPPILEGHSGFCICLVAQDITERYESEQKNCLRPMLLRKAARPSQK